MKSQTQNSKHHAILGNKVANGETFAAWLVSWRQKLGYFSIFAALPAVLASQSADARAPKILKNRKSISPSGSSARSSG